MNKVAKEFLLGIAYSGASIGALLLMDCYEQWSIRRDKIKYIKRQQKYAVQNAEKILKGAR